MYFNQNIKLVLVFNIKTLMMLILFITITNVYAELIVNRLAPEKNIKIIAGENVTFSIKASDSIGLAYSEWFITGRLQEKHIVTGYNSTDKWTFKFDHGGIYYVQSVIYNIKKNSAMIIWKVEVSTKIYEPSVQATYPANSYKEIFVGESITFQLNASDKNCELEKVEWYFNNKLINSYYISGCEQNSTWEKRFEYSGTYDIEVVVYNKSGLYKKVFWTIYAKEKNISVNSIDEGQSEDIYSSKKKKRSFIGISYSKRNMSDGKFDNLLSSNPTSFEVQFKYNKNMLASRIIWWFLNGDFVYNFGSFSQNGFKVELLMNIKAIDDIIGLSFYFGGGAIYQRSEIDTPDIGYASNDGYGGSYVGGIEIVLGNVLGLFIEYNGVATKAGELDVGNVGLALGAGIVF